MRISNFLRLTFGVAMSCLIAFNATSAGMDKALVKVGVNRNMNAELMSPEGAGPFPAILLMHTSGGLQSADLLFAEHLVSEGYVVLVPSFMEAYRITAKTRASTFTEYADAIYADFLSCLEDLKKNPKVNGKRIGAIGFSNGGYFALWLAAKGDVQAGVSYYGAISGAGTDKTLNRFRQSFNAKSSPVLILHGSSDAVVRVEKATELDEILSGSSSSHELHIYPGAEHRFERDGGSVNDEAASLAWLQTKAFLKGQLQQ